MKKSILLFALMLAGLSQMIQAQDSKKNVIKLNLMSPFIRTFNLAYERVLNENMGLQIRGYYTGYKNKEEDPQTQTKGFGIIPEFRLYLSDKKSAPAGFFIAPFIRFDKFDVTDSYEDGNEVTGTSTDFGAGLLIGHQAVFSNIVTLEVFIGPQYIFSNQEGDVEESDFNGVLPRGGLTVGLLF
jgi:hypothetical protein